MFFFFQAEDGIRDRLVTGVQTCALPISQEISELNPQIANAAQVYWGQVENICSDPVGFGRRLAQDSGITCESGQAKAAETTDNTLLIAGACAVGLGFYMYAG
mgnify:CR=1 FL=1